MKAYRIISADSHAIEPPDLWQKSPSSGSRSARSPVPGGRAAAIAVTGVDVASRRTFRANSAREPPRPLARGRPTSRPDERGRPGRPSSASAVPRTCRVDVPTTEHGREERGPTIVGALRLSRRSALALLGGSHWLLRRASRRVTPPMGASSGHHARWAPLPGTDRGARHHGRVRRLSLTRCAAAT